MRISGLLKKIGIVGTSVLTLANASIADELYNRLYSGAFNLSAKHKILDEKENSKHDGKIYLHIDNKKNQIDLAKDIVLNPQKYNFEYPEELKTDILHNITDSGEPDGVFLEIDVKNERATAICTRYGSEIERISLFDNHNKFNDLVKKYNAKMDDGSAVFPIFNVKRDYFNELYRIVNKEGFRFPMIKGPFQVIFSSEESAREFLKDKKDLYIRKISNEDIDFMKK